ncbi:MAG: carboxylating nicotinate-nucleotide diphosphorylase [Chloroflexi bacterium AL-W]|nr:carboxylating nicotinate-nucleotide diphosphorylase [Chloroflexi bacterium AL-N1]NOK70284.1 carboxylating nicotinate-nucleotide diphosphorylase [Chloroflexi bacterium AL-N10]NOK77821.1 carboxylating nicotinate-nucleotide diphosphorylase [Chloroflexi bacterium AL-N5]NOK84830.1 carboxylating nicotinate-nucleotide diphosphorylase [Chloroflexi bacterium AL-W]NOK92437.1 carboxylating nicotinate-nucleotide diphosphorylase [Chloroflexi bacterium AL-N15]
MEIPLNRIQDIVTQALQEDIGTGDLTTMAVVPANAHAEAQVVFREPGVVAGLSVLMAVFTTVDPSLDVTLHAADGDHVTAGGVVAAVVGSARSVLTSERVALNLLQRMCGIATLTARYVATLEGLTTKILDTRKTTPGLRILEKYAVHVAGGVNHRFGLYDAIMIKDNHLAVLATEGLDCGEAVRRAKAAVGPLVAVEVEVESAEQAKVAAKAGADVILLDNMSLDELRKSVHVIGGRAAIEASGGITLETLRSVAETGVDYISVGALTHSARAVDISLDMAICQCHRHEAI